MFETELMTDPPVTPALSLNSRFFIPDFSFFLNEPHYKKNIHLFVVLDILLQTKSSENNENQNKNYDHLKK